MGPQGEEAQAMSAQPSQPADDVPSTQDEDRPFAKGMGSMVAPAAEDETAAPTRPTFTARTDEPSTPVVPEPTTAPDDAAPDAPQAESTVAEDKVSPAPALGPDDGAATELDAEPVGGHTRPDVLPASDGDRAHGRPMSAVAGMDEPLLGDVAALRGRWQRVQAGFVDDPKEAVGEAADLIEQTAQALVGALRQRQRQLRVLWEHGPADGTGQAAGGRAADGESANVADTEHLRQLMRQYRTLFNQLCRP
jgi:hypothetical protein